MEESTLEILESIFSVTIKVGEVKFNSNKSVTENRAKRRVIRSEIKTVFTFA